MCKTMSRLGLLIMLFAVTGCYDIEETITLNPDGTGKIDLSFTTSPPRITQNNQEPDLEQQLNEYVYNLLDRSKGVRTWSDLNYHWRKDGMLAFEGTAYFDDINNIEFYNITMQSRPSFKIQDNKRAVFELIWGDEEEKEEDDSQDKPLTQEEINQELLKSRTQFQQLKMALAIGLSSFESDIEIQLPGTINESYNFEKISRNQLHLQWKGENLFTFLQELIKDDEAMKELVKKGKQPSDLNPSSSEVIREALFGSKEPVQAIISLDSEPQFDYENEVQKAEAAYPELFETIKTKSVRKPQKPDGSPIPEIPFTEGEGFTSLKIVGVQLVREKVDNLQPFSQPPGLTFSLLGELPGAVLDFNLGQVEKAVADNGVNLLQDRNDWENRINFVRLNKTKNKALFEVKMNIPPDEANGVKEISGTLTYYNGKSQKTLDLGITEFNTGIEGDELGAQIESIEEHSWRKGYEHIKIEIDIPPDAIIDTTFHTPAGEPIEVEKDSSGNIGDRYFVSYRIKGTFPARGSIKMKIYDDFKQFEIPFKMENISLADLLMN